MSVQFRNNIHIAGAGHATMVFAHGFGCDQGIARHFARVSFLSDHRAELTRSCTGRWAEL